MAPKPAVTTQAVTALADPVQAGPVQAGPRQAVTPGMGHMPSNASFTATVSAITDAFGDPTRRRIYLYVRDNGDPDGATTAQVAAEIGVHPNVARHHLDKLAAGGYLEVRTGKRPDAGGARAGRPSKRYVAVAASTDDFPVRSDDLVLSLLGRALSKLPADQAEQMAEEVGAEYGRAMAAGLSGSDLAAGQRSLRSAIQAVADALSAHGFAAHAEARNDKLRIINNHCPFGDVATEHPVICAVDRGMVRGMLAVLYADGGEGRLDGITTEATLAAGDTFCSTAV